MLIKSAFLAWIKGSMELLLFYSLRVFHISFSWWSFNGVWVTASLLKSPGLSILADLNKAIVWTVSIHPVIYKSFSPCTNPLLTVPRALITNGIIVTFMFLSFFNALARSRYLSLFSLSFNFILLSAWTAKSTILQVFFFLMIIIRLGCHAKIRWSVRISKSQRSLWVSFSRTDFELCIYHLFVWSYFKFPVDHFAHPVVPSLIFFLC